jgi:8-oxo-dGTP pyrophosphatase MutT (NUDIX family)
MSIFVDAKGRAHWGERAAGILMIRSDGHVLLVLRSAEVMEPGTWGIPGGKVEPGQDDWDAAFMEALEELGSVPASLEVVDQYTHWAAGFSYVTFLATVSQKDAERWIPQLNWEHDAWDWFPLDELPRRLHPGLKKVLERVKRA